MGSHKVKLTETMKVLLVLTQLLLLLFQSEGYVTVRGHHVFLPTFVPPLPKPASATREDNSLVPPATRGPYDYQGGNQQGYSKGWAARYVDQVWGEQSI